MLLHKDFCRFTVGEVKGIVSAIVSWAMAREVHVSALEDTPPMKLLYRLVDERDVPAFMLDRVREMPDGPNLPKLTANRSMDQFKTLKRSDADRINITRMFKWFEIIRLELAKHGIDPVEDLNIPLISESRRAIARAVLDAEREFDSQRQRAKRNGRKDRKAGLAREEAEKGVSRVNVELRTELDKVKAALDRKAQHCLQMEEEARSMGVEFSSEWDEKRRDHEWAARHFDSRQEHADRKAWEERVKAQAYERAQSWERTARSIANERDAQRAKFEAETGALRDKAGFFDLFGDDLAGEIIDGLTDDETATLDAIREAVRDARRVPIRHRPLFQSVVEAARRSLKAN
jgi:hypothetical protein